MENASKALIIAGAILLSILIIALGMRIYNSSTSSAANADLSATEIASFNSTFEAYEGEQKGSVVRSLITAIKNSNKTNTDKVIRYALLVSNGHLITSKTVEMVDLAEFESNKTYNVEFLYSSTNGLIEYVYIHN